MSQYTNPVTYKEYPNTTKLKLMKQAFYKDKQAKKAREIKYLIHDCQTFV